jgi:hypothetical protein
MNPAEWAQRELFNNLHQQNAELKRALSQSNHTTHATNNSLACLQTQMFKLQQSKAHCELMNVKLADMLNAVIRLSAIEVPNDTNLMELVNDINSKHETITELELLAHQQQRTIEEQKASIRRLEEAIRYQTDGKAP